MSPMIFGTAFAVGAGAIAVWTDIRIPRLAPSAMRGIMIHMLASFMILRFVAGLVGPIASSGPLAAMAAVLAIGLPAVVYAFLVGIWAIKLFQGAYAGSR